MKKERYVIDISGHWQKDEEGNLRSVNSVFQQIRGSDCHLNPLTLTLARDGRYAQGKIDNIVKLARLCSIWSFRPVSVDEIIKKIES